MWSRQLSAWFRPENEAAVGLNLQVGSLRAIRWVAPECGRRCPGYRRLCSVVGVGSARREWWDDAAEVISLEPDPINQRQLESNLALNQITNCTVIPLGAWLRGRERGWDGTQHVSRLLPD